MFVGEEDQEVFLDKTNKTHLEVSRLGYNVFMEHILDHFAAFNLMHDFYDLTLCIPTLLHYYSTFCFALSRIVRIYNGPILREGYIIS